MKRSQLALIAAGLLCAALVAGCGSTPEPAPDVVATQVAVMRAAAATLTAAAPAPPTVPICTSPTAAPVPPTPAPTAVPTALPTATREPAATPTRTAAPPPTGLPPTARPSLGLFAVVGVYSDDVLNVRSAPGADQPIVATIPYYGRDVEVYPGEQQVGGSRWEPVGYGAFTGWVNARHLARQEGNVEDGVAASAAQVILALRDHNWTALAGLAHPVKGVTFSPYTYVRPLQGAPGEADLVFSAEQLKGLWADPTVYHWGSYDGSGLPIDLTFQGYYAEFVYDVDFAQPEVIGFDEIVGQGNTINNIAEVYPYGVTVEYHFSGFDPQYGGMDWRSLRLVLEEWEGQWVLVGIVHDQWTI